MESRKNIGKSITICSSIDEMEEKSNEKIKMMTCKEPFKTTVDLIKRVYGYNENNRDKSKKINFY